MTIIKGTRGDDTLSGSDNNDLILSGNGDDTITSGDGNDLVYSGRGDDTVYAGDGNDLVITGKGDDTIDAGDGNDLVIAGKGDDTIDAGDGSDFVSAGSGNDTVIHIEAENVDTCDVYCGDKGWDTIVLVVSQTIFDSEAFQQDLAYFQAMIDCTGSASGYFSSLGIQIHSFEVLEVTIDTAGNNAPIATNVNLGAMEEDGSRLITAAELFDGAADADGDTLTITSLSIQAGNGVLTDNLVGTWTYIPAADDDSDVTFAYVVSDGALTSSALAALDMTPENDAPEATADTATTIEGNAVTIDVLANDSDVDSANLNISQVSQAQSGTVTIDGAVLVYIPHEASLAPIHLLILCQMERAGSLAHK
ncbi:cadherin-like domain-containing protein [Flexibacterium corallicola]|uniref:cadherin-like domain-containing protein n=1 Tax=Flexibacterium corallicola TaxID=3037259 RepID=UPI00286F307E|nr:cadherin-like domain-containing protein [Pseudovibrio sp. M1P-2-3]